MRLDKRNGGNRSNFSVYVPDEGWNDGFRNKGDAMGYIKKHFGGDWKKLGIRLAKTSFSPVNLDDSDDY